MAQIFTPGLQVSKNALLRRVRELPIAGEVLVAEGALVDAAAVVARAELPGDLLILRIPEALGIEPFEVERGLRVVVGSSVNSGEVLCEHAGLFGLLRSRFYSPAEGRIEFISPRTGHVGLRLPARPIELNAYVAGRVVAVEPGKSVIIESSGAFVQGIFGVGGERFGRLRLLNNSGLVDAQEIPDICTGSIIVVSGAPTAAALHAAAGAGAVGFVCGSIDDAALTGYLGYEIGIALTGDENIPMSVVVTEGFGLMPMSPRTLDLLRLLDGREASLNGATQVRAGAVRPEVIVAGAAEDDPVDPDHSSGGLQVGAAIRIIRFPLFGATAQVIELPPAPEKIETGAFMRVLRARLNDGSVVTVPRANVELIS